MNQTAEKRSPTTAILIACIAMALVVILALCYAIGAKYYENRFPRNTTINGIDVSNQTVEEVRTTLDLGTPNYTLTIYELDGATETLTAEDIGMAYEDTGELDEIYETNYASSSWLLHLFSHDEYTVSSPLQLDEAVALKAISKLNCLDPDQMTPPENAVLVVEGGTCYIQGGTAGNQVDETQVTDLILNAINAGETSVDLETAGCYMTPEVTADDPTLNQQLTQVQTYLSAVITFDFKDDRIYTVDNTVIANWLIQDESNGYTLDEDQVYDWVKTQLAYQTDTFGLSRTFTTTTGQTISLSGGDYGWCIARQDTTDKLIAAIEAGEVTTMEPEYQYTGKARGINDIGGTYVEISIADQHVWCYKNGTLVVESDCVTGNVSKGYDTPSGGVWAIDAKKSPAVLGTLDTMGYSSPVNFWMPFNGNVGMHDADGWRSAYGGTIYKTNGSHGCVNLPYSAAETIYNTVEIGTPVVVY